MEKENTKNFQKKFQKGNQNFFSANELPYTSPRVYRSGQLIEDNDMSY